MGIGRFLALCKREEQYEDNRGKVCLADGGKYEINHTQNLRVRDVCIEIAKKLGIAPVALDFFTLMTTDCENCLRPNHQVKQGCTKENDHYLNPKRLLHAEECSAKVFFFRLAFKAIPGPDIRNIDGGAFQYFVMQCRWDYLNGRILCLTRKDHLTLLILESIIRGHENDVSGKDVLDNPKKYGLLHMFQDNEFSVREIKNHLKKQITQFTTCQENIDKAKSSFLSVLEGVEDFGIKKIVVNKIYYNATIEQTNHVEWEILICANGLKKRRTYKDEKDFDDGEKGKPGSSKDEIISDYKDIEYLEIKQSASDEIIHISRQQGFLEVISVGKSMIKKESLITLIEGFYRLLVNQYKMLTRYEAGLELPIPNTGTKEFEIHGPIERKKAEALLKGVDCPNGDRSGVYMIRRSRQKFDSYNLSFITGSGEFRHYEVTVSPSGQYGIVSGPTFDCLADLLEHYRTAQGGLSTNLKKYCPIPREELCALFDEHIVVEAPRPPSTSRPANPEYHFTQIFNMQLQKLDHTFTSGSFGERIFKARCIKDGNDGYQEVFCRRIVSSRSAEFKERVIKCAEKMESLVHRNLVQFYGICFFNDQNTYLALEWIALGTLDDYLNKEVDVTVERLIMFAAQISEACMFLHQHNYVHGMLAAHNVLVVSDEHVKLSDVSVPCLREQDLLETSEESNRSPWKARECFQDRPYSKESDVWAFGVVLWEMFAKLKPFQNMTDHMIIKVFQKDHHLACPKWCPEGLRKIMKSCWITEPSRRPTFVNIVTELRCVSQKLSPQEKQRKLPQTIDENFAIEPLNVNKQSSLGSRVEEEQPSETSNQSNDGDTGGGTSYDLPSKDNEETASETTSLDYIPERGPREMVWSPEEIELKRLDRKNARMPDMIVHEEATYDHIDLEMHEASYRENCDIPIHDDELPILDDVMPIHDDEMSIHDDEMSIHDDEMSIHDDEIPTQNDTLTSSYEARGRTSEVYYSICDLDHIGFLACQLGQGGDSGDPSGTSADDSETSDKETVEEESHCGSNTSGQVSMSTTFQNLDPFAADSETRAALAFANFDRGKSEEEADNQKQTEKQLLQAKQLQTSGASGQPLAKQLQILGGISGQPMAKQLQTSGASAYKQTNDHVNRTSPGSNRHLTSNGYVIPKKHSDVRTRFPLPLRDGKSPSTSKRCTPALSSRGYKEFSKLDPFASSAEASAGIMDDSNSALTNPPDVKHEAEEPILERWKPPSHAAQYPKAKTRESINMYQKSYYTSSSPKLREKTKNDEKVPLLAGFSSFLERDPFSEILSDDQNLSTNSCSPSPSAHEETRFLGKQTQPDTTVRIREKNQFHATPLGGSAAVSKQPEEKQRLLHGGIIGGGIRSNDVTGFYQKFAKMPANPGPRQKGVAVGSSSAPSCQRVVATPSERESTYRMPEDDTATARLSIFSERDPFSEMLQHASEINEEKVGRAASADEVTGWNGVGSPVQFGCITNNDEVTSKKLGCVKVSAQNNDNKNTDLRSRAAVEDGLNSAKSSLSYSSGFGMGNFSERDVFSDIIHNSVGGVGEKPSNTSSYLQSLPSTKVSSNNNKRFGSNVAQSLNNGTCVSPYHLSTPLNSRDTVSDGKSSRTSDATSSYHANLPPTVVPSSDSRHIGLGVTHPTNNGTRESPYHISTTTYSRDTVSNGENPRAVSGYHGNLPPTEVPSSDSRHIGLGVTHSKNNGTRVNSTSSYTSSNSFHGMHRETLQDDGDKSTDTPNSRTKFPYKLVSSNGNSNVRSGVPVHSTSNGTGRSPYNRSNPGNPTSNYARFVDTSRVADKSNYGQGLGDDDTSNEAVPRSSSCMAMNLSDCDPFSEIGAARTLQVENKPNLESNGIYSSVIACESNSRSGNSPVESDGVTSNEEVAEKTEVDENEWRSDDVSGVSFGNRDPFSELCSTNEDSVKECSGEPGSRKGIPVAKASGGSSGQSFDGENLDTVVSLSNKNCEISDLMKETRNDPLAGSSSSLNTKSGSNEAHETAVEAYSTHSSSNQPEGSRRTECPVGEQNVPDGLSCKVDGSTGGSPSGNDGEDPRQSPGHEAKEKADRRTSDIVSEYAKVTIVFAGTRTYQSVVTADEPPGRCDIGAAGGEESANEVGLNENDSGPEDNEETIVDPFNISAAAESIDNLDPTWPDSLHSEKKTGTQKTEAFEESMKSHLIPFASLAFNDHEECLGKGAFGVVRKAKLTRKAQHKTRPSTVVAVKCLQEGASEIYKNGFKQEAVNLMKLNNKFIVRFLGVSYDENEKLLLVTELVPQGSLDNYLKDPKNLTILGNEVLLQFAIQITMGMQYLESKKLVHRDLAARNILVATESHVKISDFGLSRIYDDEYYRSHRENQKLPIRWLAPECLEQKKFTVYSDVWSLGVTLWEMFSYGERPYEDMSFKNALELIDYLKKGNQLEQPRACPDEVFANVRECWCLVPVNRITFFLLKTFLEDILKDKYSKKPYFM